MSVVDDDFDEDDGPSLRVGVIEVRDSTGKAWTVRCDGEQVTTGRYLPVNEGRPWVIGADGKRVAIERWFWIRVHGRRNKYPKFEGAAARRIIEAFCLPIDQEDE